jgi:DNA phosphorothioation-dependent restriction protein DptH
MSQAFRRVTPDDLNEQLRIVGEERLIEIIADRQPGHCMRVGDLDTKVMLAMATSLRATLGTAAQIHLLSPDSSKDDPLLISSSKLVELRNPPTEGEQRPPLLVFVPNDLRTAAEDSFAEATFEQLSIADAYQRLRERLVQDLPNGLKHTVPEVLRLIEEREWRWADPVAAVRFLLSVRLNGYEAEVVGASMCEFGLVPDFHLLDDQSAMPNRIAKNLDCVKTLTFSSKSDRGRVLELRLKERDFRAKLSDFLCDTGLEDPLAWTGRIVASKDLWPLSFDKWQFEEGSGFTQQLRVEVLNVSLPVIKEDEADARLRQLVGQQVLLVGQNGPKSFRVMFRSDPAPEKVSGVHHFRLQVVARESGPTGFTKKKNVWAGSRQDASVSFSKLSKVEWEEGWHFVRVLACTAEGDPVPIVDAHGQPIPLVSVEEETLFSNESDLFYVVKGDDLEVEVPQRAVPKFPSYNHALIQSWFRALADEREPSEVTCTHRAWADGEEHSGKGELLEFKFAGEGLIHVPVSRVLKILEQRILKSPDDPISWRLAMSPTQTAEVSNDACGWPSLPDIEEFRALRRGLFSKLRGDEGNWIIQASDLFPLRDHIAAYAEHYLALLAHGLRQAEVASPDEQRQAIAQLQKLLALDTVTVDLADYRGGHSSALLVGPTHPLRLLWLATWLTLAWHWLDGAKAAPEYITATRDTLLERLSLVNFPAVFPTGSGRLLTAIDNVHPFWTVYAASTESDPRGLIAEICTALGLPEPNIGSFTLNGGFLADRLRRYLVQHPYIQTLVLNCFNAGRGKMLADTLLELQKEADFRDLRYNIRLLVPDPNAPGTGDDLNELISPSSTLTVPEADAFATLTGNHLAPKLTFSVQATADFRNAPQIFRRTLACCSTYFRRRPSAQCLRVVRTRARRCMACSKTSPSPTSRKRK